MKFSFCLTLLKIRPYLYATEIMFFFILNIMVDLLMPKSVIILMRFSFCLNLSKIRPCLYATQIMFFSFVLIISSYAATIDTASSHFSPLSAFPFKCSISYFSPPNYWVYRFLFHFVFAFSCFLINIITFSNM